MDCSSTCSSCLYVVVLVKIFKLCGLLMSCHACMNLFDKLVSGFSATSGLLNFMKILSILLFS